MFALAIGFLNLLLASLLTGAMFGFFLALNPKGLSGPDYVRMQQRAIGTIDPVMPALGAATIAVTAVAAAMARHDGVRFGLLVAAVAGFLAAGLITRLRNQPINRVIMGWPVAAPPEHWTQLRDRWWRWHVARLVLGVVGLSALILADTFNVHLTEEYAHDQPYCIVQLRAA